MSRNDGSSCGDLSQSNGKDQWLEPSKLQLQQHRPPEADKEGAHIVNRVILKLKAHTYQHYDSFHHIRRLA